ncbi:MAG: hypothetical protein BZY75_01060 [SAR202 cluster bacterium Io17-Chloro-G7]|nr:MAG: hypothetical protein BZY75_01060 [SAR202 cluster bacterium Io17-Chloro-G7]
MKYLILFFALALAAVTLLPGSNIYADEGDIEVVATGAESRFPDGVTFTITARSSGEIDDIRVFFRKADQTRVSAYRTVDFEPGSEVDGESTLDSGGSSGYFPPGTRIQFSFEIRDKAGAVFRTPEQEYVYDDNRFEWLTVNSDLITVYYYGEYVEERAKTVLAAAEEAMDRMVPVLGIAPTEPLQIVSYNNYRHMAAALPFRSQAVTEQLQTQGMAFSDERVLLVHGFDATVQGTTSHEFTHLLVAEAAGKAISQVPAWLNEGLAEFGNIDPTESYDDALRYGIYTRRLRPLWYQDSFSGTPDDIIIAYGQGRSVVNFMIGKYGKENMAELFQVLQDTLNIDLALQEVYGLDQFGLDTEWRLFIGIDPLPSPEELEKRQLQIEQTTEPEDEIKADLEAETQSEGETGAGSETQAEGETSPEANPVTEESPTPTTAATRSASLDDSAIPSSGGGCSSPLHDGGAVTTGVGTLLLLATPLALLSFRSWRRRQDD